MRRSRFIAALNSTSQEQRSLLWRFKNLRPLFGETFHHDMQEFFHNISNTEHNTISIIILLRREAALTAAQHSTLRSLVVDAASMRREHEGLDEAFRKWQEHSLRLTPDWQEPFIAGDEDGWANPLTWSDEKLREVQDAVGRWKGQREMMGQV